MLSASWSSLAFLVVAFTLAADDIKFLSTWKSPDASTTSFVGKKVATLVIAQDDGLRVSGEEALARELEARGITAVASYRIVPKPELASAERAKPWFEKAAVEGVLAVRPISKDKVREYTPATWTESYYSSFWNYYSYGVGVSFSPGVDRVDTYVVVETLLFNMGRTAWCGPRSPRRKIQKIFSHSSAIWRAQRSKKCRNRDSRKRRKSRR